MLEVIYEGLHIRATPGEIGHYVDHNMHSERRAFLYFLCPGMATIHLIISNQP